MDKTLVIESVIKTVFLNRSFQSSSWNDRIAPPADIVSINQMKYSEPLLLLGPRRFGKTTILQLFAAFFGGYIQKELLEQLKIFKEDAQKWYGKFCIVHLTFGHSSGVIHSLDDCVEACRGILHRAFTDYEYLMQFLDDTKAKSFSRWTDPDKCEDLSKEDISKGLEFLVQCMLIKHNYKKRCLLLIDEFDRLFTSAVFKVNGEVLSEIVNYYSDMVGQAVKHSMICYGIFTGITSFSCSATSSLNNLNVIRVLNEKNFFPFYGVTIKEFEELLQHPEVDEKIRLKKDAAINYYDGYSLGDASLLNIYSVRKFLFYGEVKEYWKVSGIAIGLDKALKFKNWRRTLLKLMNRETLEIEYLETILPGVLEKLGSNIHRMTDSNILLNLLLQQGYLNIKDQVCERLVAVQIPNIDVQLELKCRLTECFQQHFNIDQEKLKECRDCFSSIDIYNENNCNKKLLRIKCLLLGMFEQLKR